MAAVLLSAPGAATAAPSCRPGASATATALGGPGAALAWRAGLLGPTPVYRGIPGKGGRRRRSVGPGEAPWLLVLGAGRDRAGGCWVKVRLPSRPDDAAGWIEARRALLRPTPWEIVVSRAARTLTVRRAGRRRQRFEVVVGKPATPTPAGLFSIVGVWRGDPGEFLGAWTLGLTAHSGALRHFEGGDGEVAIHGRGGASLLDPLGSAASHGCIRLANQAIDWVVSTVGRSQLLGIPVLVR
ncbi:MAG TPA: L,D-transpeptidase [Solirubrobacterales bacterium]|nr:L,D-transpeptidase [Solirubrobacterales bacterium]